MPLNHGLYKEETYRKMSSKICHLERDLKLAQTERDTVRADKTRIAAWLKKNHPAVFREYFEKVD